MILHHGTTGHLTEDNLTDGLCLAYTREDSDAYLQGDAGRIYTIELATGVNIADEEELEAAANQLNITGWRDFGCHFVLADNPQVRALLAADGWQAVRYLDQLADGDTEHDTLRLLADGIAHITDCEEVA